MLAFYIYQFAPIAFVEFLVLWRLKWSKPGLCALDSLMMNFVSFIGLLLGLGPYITSSGPWGLTLFGTYSTMVEGVVLMLLERQSTRKVWLSVIAANIASSLLLAIETMMGIQISDK